MVTDNLLSTLVARTIWAKEPKVTVRRPRKHVGNRPSVFVVIPCYNYGHYLEACVDSVLGQQDVQVDVLIIDDASTDGSANTVRQLGLRDGRIHTICHSRNAGHISTYNEGLAQASGDYTVLLSADDLLTPGSLERATSLMQEHPSVGLTYGSAVIITDDDVPLARTVPANWIIWPGRSWLAHVCKTGANPLRSPEAVMRTSVLQAVGGYSADLPHSADFGMWMRAAMLADVGFIGGADQAYYRSHSSNMHDESFGVLGDLDQRLASFDEILGESAGLAGREQMLDSAHRAMAREALSAAIAAGTGGDADQESVEQYVSLALRFWPDARDLPEWRILRRWGPHQGTSAAWPSSLSFYEATRKMKYSARWWRRRIAGA